MMLTLDRILNIMVEIAKVTLNISGLGGRYEDTCQRMLWKGVAYLSEMKPPFFELWEGLRQNDNTIGIAITEGKQLKELEEAMTTGEDDVIGYIHQAVLNHLRLIHNSGVDGWLEEARRRGLDDRIFTWQGELFPNNPNLK